MTLAASSARQGFARLMYRRLTSRMTSHRIYLLKVGQPDLLKVNILYTGWKPTTGFSCGRSTHSLVQLCLRRDDAHAIFTSSHLTSDPVPLIASHHVTSLHNKLQHMASTFNHYHSFILSRLFHVENVITFPFFPISHTHI